MSLSNFDVISQIGKGTFSTVYKVIRKTDNKLYAMKVMKIDNHTQKQIDNSLNEIRILASLSSPYIISYKESFYSNETNSLYLITEFLECSDLEHKIHKNSKDNLHFSESEIWKTFYQIVQGLKALHDNNIIHRDLKSANIFIGQNGICKIGDMNVSKICKGINTLLNTQTGTPFYASPEVWKERPYNNKSDIWSLGCILYEMCMLKLPFTGKSLYEVYNKVIRCRYQQVTNLYSVYIKIMIANLLKVDPNERPDVNGILRWMEEEKIDIMFDKGEEDIHKRLGFECKMVETMKMPKELKDFNNILPKAKYDESIEKEAKERKKRNAQSAKCDKRRDRIKLPILIKKQRVPKVQNAQKGIPMLNKKKTKLKHLNNITPIKIEGDKNNRVVPNKKIPHIKTNYDCNYNYNYNYSLKKRNFSHSKLLLNISPTISNKSNNSIISNKSNSEIDLLEFKEAEPVANIKKFQRKINQRRIISAMLKNNEVNNTNSNQNELLLPIIVPNVNNNKKTYILNKQNSNSPDSQMSTYISLGGMQHSLSTNSLNKIIELMYLKRKIDIPTIPTIPEIPNDK